MRSQQQESKKEEKSQQFDSKEKNKLIGSISLDFLEEQLASYDKDKGWNRGFFGDPFAIQQLRALVRDIKDSRQVEVSQGDAKDTSDVYLNEKELASLTNITYTIKTQSDHALRDIFNAIEKQYLVPVISITYLRNQLDQYDKEKGSLGKLSHPTDQANILKLRLFFKGLEMSQDRNLTLSEQCSLFQILPDDKAVSDPWSSDVFSQIQQKYQKGSLFRALTRLQQASCCSAENYSILLENVNFSAELAQVITYTEAKPDLALTMQMKQALASHGPSVMNVITALQEYQFFNKGRDQIELLKLTICQNPKYAGEIVRAIDSLLSKNYPLVESVIEKIAISPESAIYIASALCHFSGLSKQDIQDICQQKKAYYLTDFAKVKNRLAKTELADDKDINQQLFIKIEYLDKLVEFFESKDTGFDKYKYFFKKENLVLILDDLRSNRCTAEIIEGFSILHEKGLLDKYRESLGSFAIIRVALALEEWTQEKTLTDGVIEKLLISPEQALEIRAALGYFEDIDKEDIQRILEIDDVDNYKFLESFAKVKSHLAKTELADNKDINEKLLRQVKNLAELVQFFEQTKNADEYEFLFKKENLKCILNYSLIEKYHFCISITYGINLIYNLKEAPKEQKQKNVEIFLALSENTSESKAAADMPIHKIYSIISFLEKSPQLIEQMDPDDFEIICRKRKAFEILNLLDPDLIINIRHLKKIHSLGEAQQYADFLNFLLCLCCRSVKSVTDSVLCTICECASIPGFLRSYLDKYKAMTALGTSITKEELEYSIHEEFPVKQEEYYFTQQQVAFLEGTKINEVPEISSDATPVQNVWHLSPMAYIAHKPFDIKDKKHVLNIVFDYMRPPTKPTLTPTPTQADNKPNNIDVSCPNSLTAGR